MRSGLATVQAWLAHYAMPVSVCDAAAALEEFTESVRILICYQHFFPAAWAASTAARAPRPDQAYSDAEWEFFALVAADFFPLDVDWLRAVEDENGPAGRSREIPIWPGGVEWETLTDLRPAWQVLAVVAGVRAWGEGAYRPDDTDLPEATQTILAQVDPDTPVRHDVFQALCADAGAPLTGVPDAIQMLIHDTDSAWLNALEETPVDVEWTIHDIAFTRDDYAIARAIEGRVAPLLDWLEADPAHVARLVDLVTQAQHPETIPARPAPPRTLAELFAPEAAR